MSCTACEHAREKRNFFAEGSLATLCATGALWHRPYVRAGLIASTAVMTALSFKWAIRYQKSIADCASMRYQMSL
jgi:hypothetical protein